MTRWLDIVTALTAGVEEQFDTLAARLGARPGVRDRLVIAPYRGYANESRAFVKGRVLEHEDIPSARDDDSVWRNLVSMYKRFESDEVPGARVRVRFAGVTQELVTDSEGYFSAWLAPLEALPADRLWHEFFLKLLAPLRAGHEQVLATGHVLVPPASGSFGIISDLDDTVVQTGATSVVRMARSILLSSARTRLPFKGVAAFYAALQQGAGGNELNPIFYVSSSPWNLYELLIEFLELQRIPVGPIVLRDWGVTRAELLPIAHGSHKTAAIKQILELYPALPFILIGDSGQEDPEIYRDVVALFPSRIRAIYIRDVSQRPERAEAIRELAMEVVKAGSTLILADDTVSAAAHAAEHGLIDPATLPAIRDEKRKDETAPE